MNTPAPIYLPSQRDAKLISLAGQLRLADAAYVKTMVDGVPTDENAWLEAYKACEAIIENMVGLPTHTVAGFAAKAAGIRWIHGGAVDFNPDCYGDTEATLANEMARGLLDHAQS